MNELARSSLSICPGALIEAARPRLTRSLWRARMLCRSAFAAIEPLAQIRGKAAISLRLGAPLAIGAVLSSDALYALPVWARIVVIAATVLVSIALARVLIFDEATRVAHTKLLKLYRAHCKHLERSLKQAEARAEQSAQHARYCETMCQHAWESEAQAEIDARHWYDVARENASEGVRMARVLTTQIAQIADEAEVLRSLQLLAQDERKN